MPLISWTSTFSVGIQSMDAQHQRWFTLLNRLHDAMLQGRGKEMLDAILFEMIDYTVTHFRSEEALLESRGYANLLEHVRKHEAFTHQLQEMQTKVSNGDPVLTFDVMDSLKTWLETHILVEDKKYAAVLATTKS